MEFLEWYNFASIDSTHEIIGEVSTEIFQQCAIFVPPEFNRVVSVSNIYHRNRTKRDLKKNFWHIFLLLTKLLVKSLNQNLPRRNLGRYLHTRSFFNKEALSLMSSWEGTSWWQINVQRCAISLVKSSSVISDSAPFTNDSDQHL